MNESEYRTAMAKRAADRRRLLVAGFVDGTLAGYIESYAVDGNYYGRDIFVATEHMATGIGTGLYLETIQSGVRTPGIDQICLGPVLLGRPGITAFKRTMGFSTVEVPAPDRDPGPDRSVHQVATPGGALPPHRPEPKGDGGAPRARVAQSGAAQPTALAMTRRTSGWK